METLIFPDDVKALVEQFDKARGNTTLLRAHFRSGKSGAFVGLVDCQGRADGVYVLKIDSNTRGTLEQSRHLRALELGAFKGKLPEIVDSFEAADSHALLMKIAGGSRINWRPLLESLKLFASGYGITAQALWSPKLFSFGELQNGTKLVAGLLGQRLSHEHGRILRQARAFLGPDIATVRAFHHLGQILPNPIHFALNSANYDSPLLRPLVGPCHGDCHAANLIVSTGLDGKVRNLVLIDLAYFSEEAPFYYDLAYLELATALRQMDSIGQERWLDFASVLAHGETTATTRLEQFERSWAADIFAGRASVQKLVDSQYADRKDDLTFQLLLCHVAVGLAFINKKPRQQQSGSIGLSKDQYRQAFIWSAIYLRKFLEDARIQWIPSTQQIVPIGLQAERDTASQDRWSDLVRYELGSFNVLILSPLARSANEVIVRDLLRLPWNLIIDLGTTSLSPEHSSVRQGMVRQVWPLGSPPDLSVLARGALWFFANGRTDIGDAPPANGAREWRQKYLTSLQSLLGAIAQKIAPPVVRSLVIGDDFQQEFFRSVLESLDSHMGTSIQPILVATTMIEPLSDVPMSCARLEEVFGTIQATLDPAEAVLSEGIVIPHRTEGGTRLTSVPPDFANRIGRDLEIVHPRLGDWTSPGRAFGADFHRGQMIEWSELDNNLDVERVAQPSLLKVIRAELAKITNSTVNLLHEPSAGGTTLSRRIAWSLMEENPVVLLSQMSRNTPEYLADLFQECGLPILVVMEAEIVTESERELLFRELLDSNTRAVFLWVSRIYGNTVNGEALRAELDDEEAEKFRVAYEKDVPPVRADALARLTFDPRLREQRSPFFYGLVAFEDNYLGLEKLVGEVVTPLDSVGKELIADLALVSLYCSEGFPSAEFDELCNTLGTVNHPFSVVSPFVVRTGQYIKIPHRLIASKTLQLLARVPDRWSADLGRFALTLLQHLKRIKSHESDRLKDLVTAVFVTRDTTALLTADTEVLAGGIPKQKRFSPLILDIGSAEIARKVLQRVFNDWAGEPHFAVHYTRHLLYEEPREIERALQVVELSSRTERGKNDDTVIHTLGMCYRIRMESTLKTVRDKQQTLAAAEKSLESDSRLALECFARASILDPISEYGHLSSIQTVSTLLRGMTDLSKSDLASLLRSHDHKWLASTLESAEESITVLQSRPGGRVSIRTRQIIAQWALVYGHIDKVIQQLRALSDGAQEPGVRRALCSALLTKHKRKWSSVTDGDLQTITRLMEKNIESNDFSDSDLSRWLRASRLQRGFQIEKAIERLIDWNRLRPDAVEPAFYLYVFYFLQWLNSGRTNEGYIDAVKKWLRICQENRPLGSKKWSYEWLVERHGRYDSAHFSDLEFDPVQTIINRPRELSSHLKQLSHLEGTLSRYVGGQHALVDLGQHFMIHITPRSEIVRDDEGKHLRALISFSYDGLIGWDPELIQQGT